MERQETAILIASIVLIVLVVLTISLFLIFQKRKNSLLLHQKESEKKFERAIAETQIEIREETLRNISWELHDNIGQLLTLAKIQVSVAQGDPDRLQEASETISKSLTELRSLSKLINPDVIENLSLTEAIGLEIERFNRLQFIEANLHCNTEAKFLDSKVEIIIFRILQEFFSNTVKHSRAAKLNVHVIYDSDHLMIKAQDNGVGFDMNNRELYKGIGLCNMKSRAKLIGASVDIQSNPGQGTSIKVVYPYKSNQVVHNT